MTLRIRVRLGLLVFWKSTQLNRFGRWNKAILEKSETLATDYQRTRTFQEIRRRSFIQEYFVYGIGKRPDRDYRAERFG